MEKDNTCSDCTWFDDEDGWCALHEEYQGSADFPCDQFTICIVEEEP